MTLYASLRKGGRAPRAGVERYPSGQIKHSQRKPVQTEDEIKGTALDARTRQLLGVDHWLAARGAKAALENARKKVDDPLLSEKNPLGRLLYVGRSDPASGISQEQYDAGRYFQRLHGQWSYVRNPQRAQPVAIGANLAGGDDYTGPAPDNDAHGPAYELDLERAIDAEHEKQIQRNIDDVKARWEAMYGAVIEADAGKGHVFSVLRKVLIEHEPPNGVAEIGAIRAGLNAINRARGV